MLEKNQREILDKKELVVISGAGEDVVNGVYKCTMDDHINRVEYKKVNSATDKISDKDKPQECLLFWTSFSREWRIVVAGYKNSNTLYRHP